MSGLEFGGPPYPGTYGTTHTEGVTEDDADYFFQKKGMRVARIPFMWERVQQSLIGVGTKESFAPPSEPDRRISRIKCGPPHLMRYVAFPVMWRWVCNCHHE